MKTTALAKTALLALSVTLFAPFASATTLFFSGSDAAGDTFSGTLTATPSGSIPGAYDISGISGSVFRIPTGTTTISSAGSVFHGPYDEATPTNSPSGQYFFDDIYYSTGDADGNPFDDAGLLIVLNGGMEVNIYCIDNSTNCYVIEDDGFGQDALTSFVTSVDNTPVPEPSSLALFGTGVLGLAGAIRRRLN